MRVRAIFKEKGEFGFYDNARRYDGDEFEIGHERHFSEKWMQRIDSPEDILEQGTNTSEELVMDAPAPDITIVTDSIEESPDVTYSSGEVPEGSEPVSTPRRRRGRPRKEFVSGVSTG